MADADDELLERAREGDPAALADLYRALAPGVLGYLQARGAEDPEGLCQEVFLQVLRRVPDVHGGAGGLRTFCYSVAHARLVDEFRSRARRPALVAYEADGDPRHAPSTELRVLDAQAAARAIDLLAGLGSDQRDVVALRIVAGLSIEETAAVLGKSPGAVKQLQRRGLIALRDHVDPDTGERRST
ncbi:MAG: RNA polymerase sigma factor [Marmoricola sp.]